MVRCLLVPTLLFGFTAALKQGETHPADRNEADVSGAVWDYVEVKTTLKPLFCSDLLVAYSGPIPTLADPPVRAWLVGGVHSCPVRCVPRCGAPVGR